VVKIFVFLDLAIPPQAGLISGWTLIKEELRLTPFVFDDLIVVQRGGEHE
jgi:hypothetical protein